MSSAEKRIKRQEWRKMCKKRRRKLIRQKAAQARDRLEEELQREREADPAYRKLMLEKEQLEEIAAGREELERALRNAQWLEEEQKAQQRFEKVHRQVEAREREEREKRDRIRKEFEERERKIVAARAERRRQQEELVRMVRERHTKLQEFVATGIDDYLPELQAIHSTREDVADCNFFVKTGTCRHGLRCSGNHPTPGLSKIILIPNFFNHPALDRAVHVEYGNDGRLEYDEEDLRNSFTDFFRDIVDEFEQFGKIRQILVCRNVGPHLRGNVYIDYENVRNAAAAYLRMDGRFYAMKQLHVEFRNPIVWPAAVCGQFELKRCQKGPGCNFLHIFKNPDHRYQYDHFQESRSIRREASIRLATPLVQKSWDEITFTNVQSTKQSLDWRWSESPEPEAKAPSPTGSITTSERRHAAESGRRRKRSRNRSRERRNGRNRSHSRSRSRSRSSDCHKGRRFSTGRSERRIDPRSEEKRSSKGKRKHRSRSPSSTRSRHSKHSKKSRRKSRSKSRSETSKTKL